MQSIFLNKVNYRIIRFNNFEKIYFFLFRYIETKKLLNNERFISILIFLLAYYLGVFDLILVFDLIFSLILSFIILLLSILYLTSNTRSTHFRFIALPSHKSHTSN